MPRVSDIDVLHVDDDPDFTALVSRFLERDDDCFVVRTATSAAEALGMLGDVPVDCVVSDYDMPGRNGIEFLEAVRETHPDLPFVLFTGKGSEEVASEAISAGVTDYLQKAGGSSQYTILANRVRNAVERERALAERRENERRFDAVFEDPGMLVGVLTPGGRVTRINRTALAFVDADHDALVGTPFWETPWWADADADVEGWVARAAAGEYVPFEADLARPDGTSYSVSGTVRPVTDADGTVGSLIVSAQEITERRRRKRELEAEQAFVEQALDTLNDVFYVIDVDGRLERWNDELAAVTGYSADELASTPVTAFFDDAEAERVRAAIEAVLASGEATVQADIRTAAGETRPYEFTGARLSDPDGTVAGLVGVGRDLTERRAHERELERVRDLLEKTEEVADVGGWEIDTETMAVFWTDHLFDLLEVDYEDEPPLDEALDVYHEADRPRVEAAIETALADGEPFDIDVRFRTPAGELRWFRLRGTPATEDGEVATLRGAVQDVTSRKRDEQRLREQNDRLDEFASVVSHDLRNPLTTAAGYLELAREECESEHLERVERAHDRMSALIDDLLTLARDGGDADREPLVLDDVVRDCWKHIAHGNAALRTRLDGRVRADPTRLRQLFENLLRNGVEHSSTGPRSESENGVEHGSTGAHSSPTRENSVEHRSTDDVTITVGRLDDGFYVEDDGRGITRDDHDRVFEPGYSTRAGGTGFGLSIVEQVVDAHDWTVTLTESASGGARFEVTDVDVFD